MGDAFTSHSLTPVAFLRTGFRTVQGNDVVLAGGQVTDYPSAGGKRARAGTVVVKETGDGLYYLADGADGISAGDLNTAAVVTSVEAPDADWKSKTITWTLFADDLEESGSVLLGAGDDTIAEVVTALNANAAFAARFVASDSGAGDLLVVTSLRKGKITIRLSADLDTVFASDDGATSSDEASGAEADYRVITEDRDLIDINGDDADSRLVPSLLAGDFFTANLSNLSNEAKAVLGGRDSSFGT